MGTDSHGRQPIYESGNSENKTNAKDGCTGPMARNGSVTRFVVWDVREEEDIPISYLNDLDKIYTVYVLHLVLF